MNPTSDMVAVAWLGGITGLSPNMISTNLPQDQTTWSTSGFIVVSTIAGDVNMYLPQIRRPIVQIDAYATNPNSGKPPWGKANHLAELVRSHVEAGNRASNFARLLTFSQGDYLGANVIDAMMLSEPRRGLIGTDTSTSGDAASYARYMFDLQLTWRVAS
jgi:hypothetical protein